MLFTVCCFVMCYFDLWLMLSLAGDFEFWCFNVIYAALSVCFDFGLDLDFMWFVSFEIALTVVCLFKWMLVLYLFVVCIYTFGLDWVGCFWLVCFVGFCLLALFITLYLLCRFLFACLFGFFWCLAFGIGFDCVFWLLDLFILLLVCFCCVLLLWLCAELVFVFELWVFVLFVLWFWFVLSCLLWIVGFVMLVVWGYC